MRHTRLILPLAAIAIAATILLAQQPFPQSPASGSRLSGKHVTIYLQHAPVGGSASRTRESSGADPLMIVNDTPVSVTGTISGFASEGNARWIVLSRRDAGEVWVPVESVLLIHVTEKR